MPIAAVKCNNCGHRFELLEMPGWDKPTNQDRDGDDCEDLRCIVCGADDRSPATSTTAKSELTFPYYDHGLGREITSHGHRRRVMRELNVEEAGGERGTWGDMADAQASQNEEIDKRYAAYMKEMTEGPSRGEFARLQEHIGQEHAGYVQAERALSQRQYDAWREECAKAQFDSNKKSRRS